MVLLLFLLLVVIVLAFFYFAMLASFFTGATFVPTEGKDVRGIFEQLSIKPGEVWYELGSGDGRVVRAAATHGARAIGIEQSLVLVIWSRLITRMYYVAAGLVPARATTRVAATTPQFIHANFLKVDLSGADTVFCYLLPGLMARLKEKLEKELKPGARVISYAFKMPGWTPTQRLALNKRNIPAYVYIKKDKEGSERPMCSMRIDEI